MGNVTIDSLENKTEGTVSMDIKFRANIVPLLI